MSQTQRLGTRATSFRRDKDGTLTVQYHQTVVVTQKPDGTIILDTGGWKTNTTRTRMNQASNQFGLDYVVYQKNFEWFVAYDYEHKRVHRPFEGDRVSFRPDLNMRRQA